MEFRMEEKKYERYTHRNPVTGEIWDDKEGKWVKEVEDDKAGEGESSRVGGSDTGDEEPV